MCVEVLGWECLGWEEEEQQLEGLAFNYSFFLPVVQMTGHREQSLGAARGCLAQSTALQNPSLHHLLRPHHRPQSWNQGLSLISQSFLFLGTL